MKTVPFFLVLAIAQLVSCNQRMLGDEALLKGQTSVDDAPFKVEVSIDEPSLNDVPYKARNSFYVQTKVTNTSTKDQRLVCWREYGYNWLPDNKKIVAGTAPMTHPADTVILKPGQEREERVEMNAFRNKELPLSFRLGFIPAPNPNEGVHKLKSVAAWSNSVELTK